MGYSQETSDSSDVLVEVLADALAKVLTEDPPPDGESRERATNGVPDPLSNACGPHVTGSSLLAKSNFSLYFAVLNIIINKL